MARSSRGAPPRRAPAQPPKSPSAAAAAAGANWRRAGLKPDRQRRNAGAKVKAAAKKAEQKRSRAFPRGARDNTTTNSCESNDAPKVTTPALRLDAEIEAFARFVALTPAERAFRARMFADVKALVRGAFPGARVQLYGSSSSGLDTFRSDLDISVGGVIVSSSQRAAAHTALEDNDALESEPESDDDDYEDERHPNQQLPGTSPLHGAADASDEEPSFSLNIATKSAAPSAHQLTASAAAGKSPWNPTLRRKKIRELRALQHLLKAKRPQLQVKCLHKAKIPILAVVDPKSQLSIDIGVNREAFEASDHGRTTSLVTDLQRVLGPHFSVLVTFLKEFLHQFELDKPFTGGLGSFRLYIMVASLFPLEKCKATGQARVAQTRVPSLSSLLQAFFRVFGNKYKPKYLQSATVLRLPLFEDSSVDFASVFRLDDCVDAFAMAHDILSKTNSIESIIFEERLVEQRESVLKAIPPEPSSVSTGPRSRR